MTSQPIDTVLSQAYPMTAAELADWLRQLRPHAYVPFSQFAVAAVLEVAHPSGYHYFAGVNVESALHNRLSLHAEQSALSALVTCLGSNAQIARGFFMGAPLTHEPEQLYTWPCGHCRQLLMEFSNPKSRFQAVTLEGQFAEAQSISQLLPSQFNQAHLGQAASAIASPEPEIHHALLHESHSETRLQTLISSLQPHSLSENYQTSAYFAAVIECQQGILIPGVLMQNAAFLSTDPVMSAIANAVTRFGDKLQIQRLHLIGDPRSTHPFKISPAEHQFAEQFGRNIVVEYHTHQLVSS